VVVADVEAGMTDFTVGVPVTEGPVTTVNELVATPVTASENATVKVGVDCAPISDGVPTARVTDVTRGAIVSRMYPETDPVGVVTVSEFPNSSFIS
jgi:hypothetical protein